jgi:uncharacterized protein YwgA
MNEQQQSAIILSLIEHLRNRGSWCGETHVQKATYFLQELMGAPLNFDFILYKYGPYSFGLSDVLGAMRADSLIRLSPNPPYGPSLAPGDMTEQIKKQFPQTLKKFEKEIDFVAQQLGAKPVSELEALSTALYVKLHQQGDIPPERHVELLRELKPHIKPDFARKAVNELTDLIRDFQGVNSVVSATRS